MILLAERKYPLQSIDILFISCDMTANSIIIIISVCANL